MARFGIDFLPTFFGSVWVYNPLIRVNFLQNILGFCRAPLLDRVEHGRSQNLSFVSVNGGELLHVSLSK